MNLINEEITHKVFGEGNIVELDGSFITIDFNEDLKKFVYPDAFEEFITLNDEETAKLFETHFQKRKEEERILEIQREEEREQQLLEQQRKEKLKNHKIHESSQIVLWLDEEEQQNVFVDWQVSTGFVQSGKNEGNPNRATRLRPNSASILTVREADQEETERKIIGLYLVDEAFSGNHNDDGMIPAHAQFRVELTDEESEQMLFWNYYINKNYPHRTTWNSGKYRYFDNIWTAQILNDIMSIKTDETEVQEIAKFLEHFCKVNALDINNIPTLEGALKQ